MLDSVRRFVDGDFFHSSILALIVLNAGAMGVEATPDLAAKYEDLLQWIFVVSQVIFVLEIAARLIVHYPRLGAFFADSWNRFDFVIVVLSLVPAVGGYAFVARALRVLRILRLVSVSATIGGKFVREARGLRAFGLALALFAVLWYVFALIGFHLFGEALPHQWGSLARSLGNLSQVFTARVLASIWPDPNQPVFPPMFRAVFLFLGLCIVVNLIRALFAKSAPGEAARP